MGWYISRVFGYLAAVRDLRILVIEGEETSSS